jgi:hypothetical protein
MTQSKPFLPKNVFLAHELFLRALHLDQQDKRVEARDLYFKAAKIFTSLTKEFPNMTFFYLWAIFFLEMSF